jgi:hypothetical protein
MWGLGVVLIWKNVVVVVSNCSLSYMSECNPLFFLVVVTVLVVYILHTLLLVAREIQMKP